MATYDLGWTVVNNLFVLYAAGLFLLGYFLSIFVSYLHIRSSAVVYPLTAPEPASQFTEYIILIKTSLRYGSSLDPRGRVSLQLKGNIGDSPKLLLRKGKSIDYFLCRGAVNIFVYHSFTDLGDIEEVQIDLHNDTPYEIPFVLWRPCYISVHQPVSRNFWGCRINQPIKTADSTSESLPCSIKLRDRNGIVKAICLFHLWLSPLHSPVRIGMYNTIVHAVMVFFSLSFLFAGFILTHEMVGPNGYHMGILAVAVAGLVEMGLEALLRNTKAGFRVAKASLFQGLVEPGESLYDMDNFALNYDWDRVRPLILRQTVELVAGKNHGSAFSVFPVSSPFSMMNMWGLFDKDQENDPVLMKRILYACALPLPATMKWIAVEARGRKEEILAIQASSNFKSPACYFDTWLLDWPLDYAEEPFVAGLIISHIICDDLLMLLKKEDGRMAQLCVHQWFGLISCLFLYFIQFGAESRKQPCARIKLFIYQKLTRFGKRSPREIKASWMKRNETKQRCRKEKFMAVVDEDLNTSSVLGEKDSGYTKVPQDMLLFEDSDDSRFDCESVGAEVHHGSMDNLCLGWGDEPKQAARGMQFYNQIDEEAGLLRARENASRNTNVNMNADSDEYSDEDVVHEDSHFATGGREIMPMAPYEREFLGPPYEMKAAPEFVEKNKYRRYNEETSAYCCNKKRCKLFREIHTKVGSSALEVLDNLVQGLLDFVKLPQDKLTMFLLWKRKDMVHRMCEDMTKKARLFDDKSFENLKPIHYEGFNRNRLLTEIHNNLKRFIEKVHHLEEEEAKLEEEKDEDRIKRCIFCAKELKRQNSPVNLGCYNLDKLVKFFTTGTIYVAEKELNYQLLSRYTVQNFCASLVSQARDDAMLEMEDPPMMVAADVMQAMIHTILTDMLPKQADYNEMTADELRKLGSRLQRIKARHVKNDEERSRTREEKKRFERIKYLLSELGLRWRMASDTKTLSFTSALLGECLVQERILGLSVYSGFITKEHEVLLNGDKERLNEIESKATSAVLKIARKVCEPIVNEVLGGFNDADVLFAEKLKEMNYLVERICVSQFNAEPILLSTCCYYIADIVKIKVKEFKMVIKYMNAYKPTKDIQDNPIPKCDRPFKYIGEIQLQEGYLHDDVCSPMLRWGEISLKGEPIPDKEYIPVKYQLEANLEQFPDLTEDKTIAADEKKVLAALIGARRGIDNFTKTQDYDKERQLQYHLARVQASLMNQLAEAAEAITQISAIDADHVFEFHQDQLFNVELYATNNLNVHIATVLGIILLAIMFILSLVFTSLVVLTSAVMYIPELKDFSFLCFICILIYTLVIQPVKCVLYSVLNQFVD